MAGPDGRAGWPGQMAGPDGRARAFRPSQLRQTGTHDAGQAPRRCRHEEVDPLAVQVDPPTTWWTASASAGYAGSTGESPTGRGTTTRPDVDGLAVREVDLDPQAAGYLPVQPLQERVG